MDIPTQSELLDRIEIFCRRHDMAETRFGRDAVNNPAFLSGLRREPPVSPTLETLNKLKTFMERTDADAELRVKLAAAPPAEPSDEEAQQLPFVKAPVNPTGASSPTSSPTNAHQRQSAASASSPTSSCSSAEESPAAAPPNQPRAAAA
jgi:hypothetical protein